MSSELEFVWQKTTCFLGFSAMQRECHIAEGWGKMFVEDFAFIRPQNWAEIRIILCLGSMKTKLIKVSGVFVRGGVQEVTVLIYLV